MQKTVRVGNERAATNEGRPGELSMTIERQPELDRLARRQPRFRSAFTLS